MRIAIVSDVHGNLTALDAVIADIERRTPDLALHSGDIALVGAQPAAPGDLWRAAMPATEDEELLSIYGPLQAAIHCDVPGRPSHRCSP